MGTFGVKRASDESLCPSTVERDVPRSCKLEGHVCLYLGRKGLRGFMCAQGTLKILAGEGSSTRKILQKVLLGHWVQHTSNLVRLVPTPRGQGKV